MNAHQERQKRRHLREAMGRPYSKGEKVFFLCLLIAPILTGMVLAWLVP